MRPIPSRIPTARWISNEPTQAQVRWVLRLTWLSLAVGVALILVGNHIPPG